MDFNADGDWTDAGERIFTTQALVVGANLLSFMVPAGSTPGPTFARFRLSPNGVAEEKGTGYGGAVPLHGEVEDYQVRLEGGPEQQLDWGDAPDSTSAPMYPTLAVHNGARHELFGNFTLGTRIDAEADGQPNAAATGDDLAAGDDEDGVVFIDPLIAGSPAKIDVTLNPAAGMDGFLDAWFDWNGDGNWTGAGEHVFIDQVLVPGVNSLVVNVPAAAKAGPTYARFRLAQQPGAVTTPEGFGFRGEVEDYNPRIQPVVDGEFDWGDAPQIPGTILQYPTLASSNGARHGIVDGFHFGGKIDPEADGQPTILADGDDANGSDDEDGITFLEPLIPGQPAKVQIDLTNAIAAPGLLDAWIDWGADGNWQAVDTVASAVPLNPGANILVVNVPANAASGRTYSRWRLSLGGAPTDGFIPEGEVEDHVVEIRDKDDRKLDWGDAPQSAAGAVFNYPTTAAVNGARHVLRPGFYMGMGVDAELDGQPTIDALGDDNNGVPDDEDGVTFVTPIVPGGMATIHVVAPLGGILDAWIDFQHNGNWSDAGDRIFTTHPLAAGVNVLNVPIPAAALPGETYARFRLSPNGVASYDGFGFEGEVEDYRIKIGPHAEFDWGDAPKSYRTLAVHSGPHHKIQPGFTLGNLIDAEPDGQPGAGANRDDLVGVDDEDGVTLPAGALTPGANNVFTVSAPGGGVLDAWMDLNVDGDFADPGEKIFSGVGLAAGVNNLNYFVPVGTPPGTTYARFRLTRQGIGTFTGFGGDGEVEDYIFKVRQPTTPEPKLDWGDAPTVYPVVNAQNGARHSHLDGFTLGYRWDSELDGQPSIDALRDDLVGIDDEDGVQFLNPIVSGGVATIAVHAPGGGVLDAWIDWHGNADWATPGDRIATTFPLAAGMNILNVPVPAGLPANMYRTFARFRLSPNGVPSFTGFGFEGEVEDYRIIVNGPSITYDPTTGALDIQGTPGNDYVYFSYNPQTESFAVSLEQGESGEKGGTEDINIGVGELQECSIDLFGGDDTLILGDGVVDAADYVVWRKTDGSTGTDKFMVDDVLSASDTNVVIDPNQILIGLFHAMPESFEELMVETGGGNDQLLAVGLGGPDTMPDQLVLGGNEGDDSFYVVGTGLPAVQVVGGAQHPGGAGDSLSLFGDMTGFANYTPTSGAPDSGLIQVGFNPQPEPPDGMIQFTGLEPVNIAGFAGFTLQLPAGPTGSDAVRVDPLLLPTGNATMLSGLTSGIAFEHAVVSNVGALKLDVAANDLGPVTNDVVDFNGSILGVGTFTMPAGLAEIDLNVNAGAIPINWDPGALGARADVFIANGAVTRFETTQHLSLLQLATGSNAFVAAGGDKILSVVRLDVQGTGTLDMNDNDMIVHTGDIGAFIGGAYTGLTGLIAAAYNFGAWDKPGIKTMMPDALGGLTTLALARAADILFLNPGETGMWNGEVVTADAVLIKYSYAGDGNLDGLVDAADYGAIDNWVQFPGTDGYANGDFNFDGIIDAADYGIIDNSIQLQGPPL
jgi:hypothetical protein